MTILEHVSAASLRLAQAGLAPTSASFDAEVLARHTLGWDRATYFSNRRDRPPADFVARYDALVARRARREPVPFITGHREFWGLDFEVTPAVLTPRPDTELIVEEVLALAAQGASRAKASWLIVDVGTGSGCLAITLAHEWPDVTIIATDVSETALAVARRNAAHHQVTDRITFARTSFLDNIEGTPDLIVSNPPYVPSPAAAALAPEVSVYEPRVAIDGGLNGLDVIHALLGHAEARLQQGGYLVMEFGAGQDDDVRHLVAKRDKLKLVKVRHDLLDIPRTAVIRRQ